MGDYEDRYPEAYGRGEEKPLTTRDALKQAQTPRQTRDGDAATPQRVGTGMPLDPRMAGPAARTAWRHAPAGSAAATIEPTAPAPAAPQAQGPIEPAANYRGIGPRGYVRAPARIYEDICDRLTENPFIDASDIDVAVTGARVLLRGRVNDMTALHQAEEIARETAGVAQVRNELTVTQPRRAGSPGAQINRAMGTPPRR